MPIDPHLQSPSGLTRARGAGIAFPGTPGRWNAITDVQDVSVGYCTLIEGTDIRTGVTAILPRQPRDLSIPVFGGFHSLNGNGELTGTIWVEEAGTVDGPITITNTHSCGTARDATIKWMRRSSYADGLDAWSLPVAGETYDGYLNDINGFHVTDAHVFAALDAAIAGPVDEGSVGGGTGMICYGYKGGSGTSSRLVEFGSEHFVVGAFVQANFGRPEQLTMAGVPVGRSLSESTGGAERGSVIAIVATDAPLLPHQLKRLARRVGLGIGKAGATSGHGSGDIFLAFSTANRQAFDADELATVTLVPNSALSPFFDAVVEAIDEAVLNSLFCNQTMQGFENHVVEALPHALVRELVLSRGGRLDK